MTARLGARVPLVLVLGIAVLAAGAALVADLIGPGDPDHGPTLPLQLVLDLVGLAWALAGAVVVWRRRDHPLGWLLMAVGSLTQVSLAEEALTRADVLPDSMLGDVLSLPVGLGILLLLGLLPLLYPTGRLPSPRWRPLAAGIFVGAVAMQVQWLLSRVAGWRWPFDAGDTVGLPEWAPFLLYASGTVLGWVLCTVRIARADRPERSQLVLLLAAVVLPLVASATAGESTLGQWLMAASLMLLPVAVVVGILRYRMFGIELFLRRGLVYSGLTACILAVYAAASWTGGVHLGGDRVPTFLAAGLVALGLLPLRSRLQRWVDLLVYGRRGDPVSALTDLGAAVAEAEAGSLAALLVARTRLAVRAPGARVLDAGGAVVATSGSTGNVDDDPQTVAISLDVGGEVLGRLEVAPRTPGEHYGQEDERLLRAIGPQVAVALLAMRTAAELERQRDAVVAARTGERSRLRGDLHDGLGPSLTGIGLGLRAVDDALSGGDGDRAREIVDVIRAEVGRAVEEVRGILEDLRPPGLVQDGLVEALRRAFAERPAPPPVLVEGAVDAELPPEVEDAAYRIAVEAVHNALRHAQATRVTVRIDWLDGAEGHLAVEVCDDGTGMPCPVADGLGLPSMRARAAAVGGTLGVRSGHGTRVRLVVPVRALGTEPAAPRDDVALQQRVRS